MYYFDAVAEILNKASDIKPAGRRVDVVTLARREFAKRGYCDAKLIDPIESVLRECLQAWSPEQKRAIWETTETGAASTEDLDAYDPYTIDMQLEGELMHHLIEDLSGTDRERDCESDD